jgi:hypothetical protein
VRFIFEASVRYSNNYRFTFDVNLNVNVNKQPQFSPYQNLDYKIKVACPTDWIKAASSNTSNFTFVCKPSEANFTDIGLVANTAYTHYMNSSKQKQYLSSVLSSLRNDTKLRIINSSYTIISNNSALQVLISSNGTQIKELYTVTGSGYYTIYYYVANSEDFSKYLPIAQKVINSFQIIGPKLPDLSQLPKLPQLPPLLP